MAEVIVKVGLASTIDEAHSVLMREIGESGMKLSGGEKHGGILYWFFWERTAL